MAAAGPAPGGFQSWKAAQAASFGRLPHLAADALPHLAGCLIWQLTRCLIWQAASFGCTGRRPPAVQIERPSLSYGGPPSTGTRYSSPYKRNSFAGATPSPYMGGWCAQQRLPVSYEPAEQAVLRGLEVVVGADGRVRGVVSEVARGVVRGVVSEVARGVVRGVVGEVARGVVRGVVSEVVSEVARGVVGEVVRGVVRGVVGGVVRGVVGEVVRRVVSAAVSEVGVGGAE